MDLQDLQSLTNAQHNGRTNHVQREPQEFMNQLYLLAITRRKVSIYHDWHFWSLLKTPPSTMILGGFVVDWKTILISEVLYCHRLGKIMADGCLEHGRCRFFNFASNFGLWPTFSGCGAVMSVSLADLFFCPCDLAHVARCNSLWSGPWVPNVSLSVRLSVPHHCWLLAFIFWNRSLW
jgi:hypothetical protein